MCEFVRRCENIRHSLCHLRCHGLMGTTKKKQPKEDFSLRSMCTQGVMGVCRGY